MMRQRPQDRAKAPAGLSAACAAIAACAASCATTQALADAPVEFWQTAEKLVVAIGQDLEAVLLFLLGL
jgi:ABC-type glycerol-3-phosphate transport system substrate-binding protein